MLNKMTSVELLNYDSCSLLVNLGPKMNKILGLTHAEFWNFQKEWSERGFHEFHAITAKEDIVKFSIEIVTLGVNLSCFHP